MILAETLPIVVGHPQIDTWIAWLALIGALGVAGEVVRRVVKWGRKVSASVGAVYDLAPLANDLKAIAAELTHNGGASLKDQVVDALERINKQQAQFDVLLAAVQENQVSLAEIHTSHETHLKLAHRTGYPPRLVPTDDGDRIAW